jgi:ankyrin repeat and LEM domain-containing protein 1
VLKKGKSPLDVAIENESFESAKMLNEYMRLHRQSLDRNSRMRSQEERRIIKNAYPIEAVKAGVDVVDDESDWIENTYIDSFIKKTSTFNESTIYNQLNGLSDEEKQKPCTSKSRAITQEQHFYENENEIIKKPISPQSKSPLVAFKIDHKKPQAPLASKLIESSIGKSACLPHQMNSPSGKQTTPRKMVATRRFQSPERAPDFYQQEESRSVKETKQTPRKQTPIKPLSINPMSPTSDKQTQTTSKLVKLQDLNKISMLPPQIPPIPSKSEFMAELNNTRTRVPRTRVKTNADRPAVLNKRSHSENRIPVVRPVRSTSTGPNPTAICNRLKNWLSKLSLPQSGIEDSNEIVNSKASGSADVQVKQNNQTQGCNTMPKLSAKLATKELTSIRLMKKANERSQSTNTTKSLLKAKNENESAKISDELITDRIGAEFFNHVLGSNSSYFPTPSKQTPIKSILSKLTPNKTGYMSYLNTSLSTRDANKNSPSFTASSKRLEQNKQETNIITQESKFIYEPREQKILNMMAKANEPGALELDDLETHCVNYRPIMTSTDHNGSSLSSSSSSSCTLLTDDLNSSVHSTSTFKTAEYDPYLYSKIVRDFNGLKLDIDEKKLDVNLKDQRKAEEAKGEAKKRKTNTKRNDKINSPIVLTSGYSVELTEELNNKLNNSIASDIIEAKMFNCFKAENSPQIEWREGHAKCAFNYLLIDPQISQNLPLGAKHLSEKEVFGAFIRSIFYIGKGSRARPYAHLYDAQRMWKSMENEKHGPNTEAKASNSKKIKRIIEIWRSGQGIVSLHCFQSVIPSEAYTREAAMIDAIGLHNLTNMKRGNYYGEAKEWADKRKRQLGTILLRRACAIFLAEGERQITPADI